ESPPRPADAAKVAVRVTTSINRARRAPSATSSFSASAVTARTSARSAPRTAVLLQTASMSATRPTACASRSDHECLLRPSFAYARASQVHERRSLKPDTIAARDGMKPIRPKSGDLRSLKLSPEEGFVLSRVDAPTSVKELVALTGLDESR